MTLQQSKEFVVEWIMKHRPVMFTEEAVEFCRSQGYVDGDIIEWNGEFFQIVKRNESCRILETRRLPTTRTAKCLLPGIALARSMP